MYLKKKYNVIYFQDNNDDNHRKSVLTAHRPCREPEGAAEEEEISVWEEKRITITVEKFENFVRRLCLL